MIGLHLDELEVLKYIKYKLSSIIGKEVGLINISKANNLVTYSFKELISIKEVFSLIIKISICYRHYKLTKSLKNLMLTAAVDQVSNNLLALTLAITITCMAMTIYIIKTIPQVDGVNMERQIDTTRVQEGLPTDVTITPEDFRANPELAEIFDVTDTDANLNVALESQEHLEMLEAQSASINFDNVMAVLEELEAIFSYFF